MAGTAARSRRSETKGRHVLESRGPRPAESPHKNGRSTPSPRPVAAPLPSCVVRRPGQVLVAPAGRGAGRGVQLGRCARGRDVLRPGHQRPAADGLGGLRVAPLPAGCARRRARIRGARARLGQTADRHDRGPVTHDAEAIRAGADMSRTVDARRKNAGYAAGGHSTSSTSPPCAVSAAGSATSRSNPATATAACAPRLTAAQLVNTARDRDELVDQLRRFGYPRQKTGRSSGSWKDRTKPGDHLGIANVFVTRAPPLLPVCANAWAPGTAERHLTSLNTPVRQ